MAAFTSPESIVNRGLQKLGAFRVTSLATDTTKQATEANFLYPKLRRAELRRNTWRFAIRRCLLRAVGSALPAWDATVTYVLNSLVSYNGLNYISIHATPNLNQNPATATTYWTQFSGNTSQKVTFPAWAIGTTYGAGAIVLGSDNLLYLSMVASNLANDPTTDDATHWTLYFGSDVASALDPTTTYGVGELVFDAYQNVYYSLANGNPLILMIVGGVPLPPGPSWALLTGATIAPIVIPWPAGTGPASEQMSRNVFPLPYGYLFYAPQDPKAGSTSYLGFPSNLINNDWVFEGGYLISMDPGPIMFRFAADVTQVALMDDLFCEGFAARIALEMCESLTQSQPKLASIASEYKQFMSEARQRNGIETGPTEPPMDDFLAVRF